MRQHVSNRLGTPSQKEARAAANAAKQETLQSHGKKSTAAKRGKIAALAVEAAATFGKTTANVAEVEDDASEEVDGEHNDNSLGGERDQLSGAELLDVCNFLEDDNLGLRQRLAKLELQRMQKEHGEDDEEPNDDSQLALVMVGSTPSFRALLFHSLLCLIFATKVYATR